MQEKLNDKPLESEKSEEELVKSEKEKLKSEILEELREEGLLKTDADSEKKQLEFSNDQTAKNNSQKSDISIIVFLLMLVMVLSTIAIFVYLIFSAQR